MGEDPREEYRIAQAALKTSLFQWSPDWTSASHHFDRAGKGFKLREQWGEAIQAYSKAAEAHLKVGETTSAAMSYGEIADSYVKAQSKSKSLDKGTIASILDAFDQSSVLYMEDGHLHRAATVDLQAAKSFEKLYLNIVESGSNVQNEILDLLKDTTLNHFMSACEKFIRSDRIAFGLDAFPLTLRFCCRIEDYPRVISMLKRMVKVYADLNQQHKKFQCYLSLSIMHLKRNDAVAARKDFSENLNDTDYLRSAECEAAETLISAWEAGNEEAVTSCVTKNHTINGLDRQIVIVARSLNPYKVSINNQRATTVKTLPKENLGEDIIEKAENLSLSERENQIETALSAEGSEINETVAVSSPRKTAKESSNVVNTGDDAELAASADCIEEPRMNEVSESQEISSTQQLEKTESSNLTSPGLTSKEKKIEESSSHEHDGEDDDLAFLM